MVRIPSPLLLAGGYKLVQSMMVDLFGVDSRVYPIPVEEAGGRYIVHFLHNSMLL